LYVTRGCARSEESKEGFEAAAMDFRTITVLLVLMLDAVVRATPYATDRTKLDGFYHIRQLSSGRYLDAYDQAYFVPSRPGFEVVSRDEQYAGVRDSYDKTQFWYILGNDWGSYSLMQYTSGRFLDSCQPEVCKGHSGWQWDNVAVTQPANDSIYATTQRWVIQAVANTSGRQYADFHGRIIQSHTQMFLNSYSSADKDDQVYLSDDGTGNDTIWVFEHMNDAPVALLDGVFTLTQESSGRNLDADDKSPEIHSWTNEATFTERQHFLIRRVKGEVYTITHMSSGRLLGASVPDGEINATVAPALIAIGTQQQWMLVYIRFNTFVFQHVMTGRILSSLPYNESTGLVNAVMPSLAMYDGNASETVWKVRRVGIAPILGGMYIIRNKLTQDISWQILKRVLFPLKMNLRTTATIIGLSLILQATPTRFMEMLPREFWKKAPPVTLLFWASMSMFQLSTLLWFRLVRNGPRQCHLRQPTIP
jgi:hypothetical protein